MYILYGIKNCDTVRKARKWLDAHDKPYRFHDFRVDGLEPERLEKLANTLGWETLLNRRSTSWRAIPEQQKNTLDKERALQLMQNTPTLIKRPILDTGEKMLIGFNDDQYKTQL